MRTFDFAPLYRSTIGFDRLFSTFEQTNLVRSSGPGTMIRRPLVKSGRPAGSEGKSGNSSR
jgi:hypothetical protein